MGSFLYEKFSLEKLKIGCSFEGIRCIFVSLHCCEYSHLDFRLFTVLWSCKKSKCYHICTMHSVGEEWCHNCNVFPFVVVVVVFCYSHQDFLPTCWHVLTV